MRLTPENTKLWIVNYKRPEEVKRTIQDWLNSFPFQEVNVISNHSSDGNINQKDYPVPINIYHQWQREDWEYGALAQCWNLCMKKTFITHDWCVMSQDDNKITPGWADKINATNYEFYVAPHGDSIQIQSLEGFKYMGFFDERFRALGGPESDYILRCLRSRPEIMSIYDRHVWQMRHNTVGLEDHFELNHTQEVMNIRWGNVLLSEPECFQRWIDKWGKAIDPLFIERDYYREMKTGWEREINWYPSWTGHMQNLGRL